MIEDVHVGKEELININTLNGCHVTPASRIGGLRSFSASHILAKGFTRASCVEKEI